MKSRVALCAFALSICGPALACGPTASSSSTSSTTVTTTHRQKWVKKRVLRLEIENDIDQLAASGGHPSREVARKMWTNRLEYLMLKREVGAITPKEEMELNWILQEFYPARNRH
jgi:hypothetical protein